jgi:hypothetical protein
MNELIKNVRNLVIDTIFLLSSKEKQLEYQKRVPYADVSAELFCQWDSVFVPESDTIKKAFSKEELSCLNEFNRIFNKVSDSTPDNLPPIDKFIKSSEWYELANAAQLAIKKCQFVESDKNT